MKPYELHRNDLLLNLKFNLKSAESVVDLLYYFVQLVGEYGKFLADTSTEAIMTPPPPTKASSQFIQKYLQWRYWIYDSIA